MGTRRTVCCDAKVVRDPYQRGDFGDDVVWMCPKCHLSWPQTYIYTPQHEAVEKAAKEAEVKQIREDNQ